MRRIAFVVLFMSVFVSMFGQYYYKCIGVYDNNMNPYSKNSTQYKVHIDTHMMLNYVEGGLTYKFHNALGAVYLSYAGKDGNTGNVFYAHTFMGQPQFQDLMGNYMFVQFEYGTNNVMVAAGGIMKECTPVTQQDYFNYVALIGTAPGIDNSYSSGGGNSSGYGSGSSSTNELNEKNYRRSYASQEKIVETWYKSCTTGGYRTQSNGTQKGGMDASTGSLSANSQMLAKFRIAQRELRKIREEAARNGVNISPSHWETATVSVY